MAGQKQDTAAQSDKRDRSWARGKERKEAHRKAQDARERANRDRGGNTPWQHAKALRKHKRAEARRGAA